MANAKRSTTGIARRTRAKTIATRSPTRRAGARSTQRVKPVAVRSTQSAVLAAPPPITAAGPPLGDPTATGLTRKAKAGVPASVAIKTQPPSKFGSAAEFFPSSRALPDLQRAALDCRACDLWRTGTQTVFGEGGREAEVVFVGETPGDQEDRQGRPFVGPAGRLLDEALQEAGIDRSHIYVTNVVKHFKWEPLGRGDRRLHKKPSDAEIKACKPWLEAEIEALQPRVLVCLGSTAAQALLGKSFRVTRDRGKPLPSQNGGPTVIATVHPSSVLRAPDENARREARRAFFADLRVVAREIRRP
jgi:uracil-DNA glycosylase family protein